MTTRKQNRPGLTLRTDVSSDENTFFASRDQTKTSRRAWQLGLVLFEKMDSYFWRAVFVEGLATLFFLFAVVSVVTGNQSNPSPITDSDTQLLIVMVFGVTIFILVYFTAGISGGNINPAVSFGLMLGKRISVLRFACYVIAQVVGAIIGTLFAKIVVGPQLFNAANGASNSLKLGISSGQAVCGEIICTAALVLSVLVGLSGELWVLTPKSKIHLLLPLVVGSTVAVSHMIMVPIDGTSINPARSIGPAIVSGTWGAHWVFWVGPLLGAIVAVVLWEGVIRPPQVIIIDAAGREHEHDSELSATEAHRSKVGNGSDGSKHHGGKLNNLLHRGNIA